MREWCWKCIQVIWFCIEYDTQNVVCLSLDLWAWTNNVCNLKLTLLKIRLDPYFDRSLNWVRHNPNSYKTHGSTIQPQFLVGVSGFTFVWLKCARWLTRDSVGRSRKESNFYKYSTKIQVLILLTLTFKFEIVDILWLRIW